MKLIIYSVFLLFLAPCNGTKKTASTASSGTSASATTQTAAKNQLRTVSFSLQKTACFGRCPMFTLTINGETNTATYKGDQNVDKVGTYEKKISDDELQKLVDAFEKRKLFDMQDAYNKQQVTDLPSTYVSYSINGKSKKIQDRFQAPPELKELEKLLDDFGNTDGWEKIKDAE